MLITNSKLKIMILLRGINHINRNNIIICIYMYIAQLHL